LFGESGCFGYLANVEVAQVHFVFEMIEKGFIPAVPKLRFDVVEIFKVADAVLTNSWSEEPGAVELTGMKCREFVSMSMLLKLAAE
jgi:hypothetical protein